MLTDKLKEAYENNAFGIYIGSGVSQASGLPNWENLLLELIEQAKKVNSLPKQKEDELKRLVKSSSNYLMIAEELREILHADLQKYIKKRFDDNNTKPSSLLSKIVNLNYKFIVTTNYDTLIEKAYISELSEMPNVLTYKDASDINYNILNNEKFILKAHGDAKKGPHQIVLTSKDYRDIIFKEKGYQSVLQVLFSTCNILFIGASLRDPELELLLGYIHHIFHGGSPDHFALMNKEELTSVEIDRWRKDYNINIISYDPSDNHRELELYVDELLKIKK
jgi:hypothetical protein